MEQFHGKSRRKTSGSGGMRRRPREKRRHEAGGFFAAAKVGKEDARKLARTRGGALKVILKRAAFANVATKEGTRKARILAVAEAPDNRHYARMGIITKGAVVNTELGRVRVTSRPGQDGVVNAVLLDQPSKSG